MTKRLRRHPRRSGQADANTVTHRARLEAGTDPGGERPGPAGLGAGRTAQVAGWCVKALRRFVRDAELARGSDLAELDARPAAHCAPAAAPGRGRAGDGGPGRAGHMLRAMEALAQKFVERPSCAARCGQQGRARQLRADRIPGGRAQGQELCRRGAVPAVPRRAGAGGGDRVHPGRPVGRVEWRWIEAAGRPCGRTAALRRRPCARGWTRRC
jgi:hypothetical protein